MKGRHLFKADAVIALSDVDQRRFSKFIPQPDEIGICHLSQEIILLCAVAEAVDPPPEAETLGAFIAYKERFLLQYTRDPRGGGIWYLHQLRDLRQRQVVYSSCKTV
ncbi:hypothetical protein SDC9_140630 [bioreactor metagenome]|uniref:Uncharacterized protein n=1 Tax=bioreactor metagenome TaxID=1076179 RepID=A0A645DYT1_9ZZZZ